MGGLADHRSPQVNFLAPQTGKVPQVLQCRGLPRALAPNQLGLAQPRPAVGGAAPGAGSRAGRVLEGPGPSILSTRSAYSYSRPPGLILQSVVDLVALEIILTTASATIGVARSHLPGEGQTTDF